MPDDTGEDQQKSDSQQPEKIPIPLKLYLHGNCGYANKVWYVGRYEETTSESTGAAFAREFDVTFLPSTTVTNPVFCVTVRGQATGAVVPSTVTPDVQSASIGNDNKAVCAVNVSKPQPNWPQVVVFTITVAVDHKRLDRSGPEVDVDKQESIRAQVVIQSFVLNINNRMGGGSN